MKTKVLKFYSSLLSFFLVWLGFTSCSDDENNEGPIICEYGVPSALYKVNGNIVSKEDQKPVQNIRAVLVEVREGKEDTYRGDTVYTDAEGKFNLKLFTFPVEKVSFNLKVDDVDGEANGSFDSKIEPVVFDKPQFTNGDNWFKGETTQEVGKIEIVPSKDE